jgi:hypothetical protein
MSRPRKPTALPAARSAWSGAHIRSSRLNPISRTFSRSVPSGCTPHGFRSNAIQEYLRDSTRLRLTRGTLERICTPSAEMASEARLPIYELSQSLRTLRIDADGRKSEGLGAPVGLVREPPCVVPIQHGSTSWRIGGPVRADSTEPATHQDIYVNRRVLSPTITWISARLSVKLGWMIGEPERGPVLLQFTRLLHLASQLSRETACDLMARMLAVVSRRRYNGRILCAATALPITPIARAPVVSPVLTTVPKELSYITTA